MLFKVVLKDKPDEIQGLLKVSLVEKEIFFMDNLEVSPENYGSKGRYDYVAGALFAYASLLSLKYGKGGYYGFVIFDSKTKLIDYYKTRYGATVAFGKRMYIKPETGKLLREKYLNI